MDIYKELKECTGGSIVLTEVLGGYSTNYTVGGNVMYGIKKALVEWRLSKDKLKTAKEILLIKDARPEDICRIVKELMELSDEELIKALFKLVNGNEPMEIALRKLYYVWKDLIEAVLRVAIKKQGKKDISIKSINLANLDKIIDHLSPEISSLIKRSNYKHKGYCPHEPGTRIMYLMEFPLDEIAKKLGISLSLPKHALDLLNFKLLSEGYVFRPKETLEGSYMDECLEALLQLYKNTIDVLIEYEGKVIHSAKNISNFAIYIQKIIVDLLKLG